MYRWRKMDTIAVHSDDVPSPLDAHLSYSRAQQKPHHDTSPPLRPPRRTCAADDSAAQHAEHDSLTEVRPEDGGEGEEKVVGRTGAPETFEQGLVAEACVEVAVVEYREAGEQEVEEGGSVQRGEDVAETGVGGEDVEAVAGEEVEGEGERGGENSAGSQRTSSSPATASGISYRDSTENNHILSCTEKNHNSQPNNKPLA